MLDDDYNDVEDDEIVVVDEDVDDKIVVDDDIKNSKLSGPWQFRIQDFKVLLPTTHRAVR